ncbi:kinesin-like protein Klp61F [Leptopilina heterotoma]|uniref:kinesin-like protein Klp61F n=1 Tax=Leptopilina heterotoma TaxID=63436 RepID=UPI001CA9FAA5|nr:kinesin-like protein Klp61F [Leptopilina heterotoma]
MNDTRPSRKDKNQNIQVFVRVRPINNFEKTQKSALVVDVPSNKDVVVRERPNDKISKKFSFDRVFGPHSKQIDVYNAVVHPLLDEVLAGYNCTVFAYGQTGTGKTFTMEGYSNDPGLQWQSDTSAGIIPRALSHLFDEIRTLDAQEYSVRVSFLELYNEELFDLLSPNDDASKIRLYEDAAKKGAVIIHGLEEVTVHNKSEVYKILEKGSEKRQTAATLMNAQSSRSHTVFSITVHIKENTVDGEELMKTGKLNLVDLAGSENIGRSGAVERRAREAGNINQSLLTLGRVITALVERAPHIPYRESKLTRLLQESLGGRTKTSIIATVSPASINLDETLSTLDYAHRAKNITNRPEINQKLSKKALLKEYTEEIERLRRDLAATRERNGVYLAQENFNEMQTQIECQGKEIEDKINHIKAVEEAMQTKEKLFDELQSQYKVQTEDLYRTKNDLNTTRNVLKDTELDRDVHKHLVDRHATTEKVLSKQAQILLDVAETATTDTQKLHDKIMRKTRVEEENENLGQQFRKNISKRFQRIEQDLSFHAQGLVQCHLSMKDQVNLQTAGYNRSIDKTINHISKELTQQEGNINRKLTEDVNESYDYYYNWIILQLQSTSGIVDKECDRLHQISSKLASGLSELVNNKITENLRSLNKEMTSKLENYKLFMNETLSQVSNELVEEHDRLASEINNLKAIKQSCQENQNNIQQNRKTFEKAFENLWQQYQSIKKSDEENQNSTFHLLQQVDDKYDSLSNHNACKRKNNIDRDQLFKSKASKDIQCIQTSLTKGFEKNWRIAEKTIEQSKQLTENIELDLEESRNTIREYQKSVTNSTGELQQKTAKDKSAILSSVQELHKIVADASVDHVEFMEDQRNKVLTSSTEICRKLETQSVEFTEWNIGITTELRTTQHQIDKFLVEDLRRDVPTGTTPVRKDFRYPQKLVATSPRERIVKRFIERARSVGESEDEDSTIIGVNTSPTGNNVQTTSTPNSVSISKLQILNGNTVGYPMVKAASASDISIIARPSNELIRHSESDLPLKQNDKENDEEEFIKPNNTKIKRLSKLKSVSRKVLGSCN